MLPKHVNHWWGYNGQDYQPQRALHRAHLRAIQPRVAMTTDNVQHALELKHDLPNSEVISRMNPPGGMDNVHRRMTPQQFMDWQFFHHPPEHGIVYYVENESTLDQTCIDWLLEVAKIAVSRGVKVVLGNWSVGFPGDMRQIIVALPLIKYAAEHPDLIIIGLHDYCDIHWSSGIEGHSRENPLRDVISHIKTKKLHHMGRFWQWFQVFEAEFGLKFQIWITEWGWDLVEQKQYKGQWDCKAVWKHEWGVADWQIEAANQLMDAKRVIYDPAGDRVALVAFCWSPQDEKWQSERFDTMERFLPYVEEKARTSPPTPDYSNVEIPMHPDLRFLEYHDEPEEPEPVTKYKLTWERNSFWDVRLLIIRNKPTRTSSAGGFVFNGSEVVLTGKIHLDRAVWYEIEFEGSLGWIAGDQPLKFERVE